MNLRIGIDLGGTKIEGVLIDTQHVILKRLRVATPADDYAATLNLMAQLIADLQQDLPQVATVGIGTPGAVSLLNGRMKNCNSTCLNNQFLQRDLEALLGYSIRIANDADCFALSEAVDGAASNARSVFGVIIGTGTGGGVVINGQLLSGPNRIAGEWGHNRMPGIDREFTDEARRCYCGRINCIETFLSGPGFSQTYQNLAGKFLAAHEIVARVDTDAPAVEALDLYYLHLAFALSQVINVLDPEVIVLGGGMSNIDSIYTEVPKRWSSYVFSDSVETRLCKAMHGDSSGVRGAAWLW
jgi:predicted NBD/HSP70 family sugar kinase